MSDEHVRIVLERSGGFVGQAIRRGLDSAALPADEAARLRGLVAGVEASGGRPDRPSTLAPRPDRFTYTLEVDRGGHRLVRRFSEPVPAELRQLLTLLSKAPLLPAHR
ncbi:protealysin inhibitor emfourin [Frankia sp. CiP3]|uniref:protealysin inhibitor emfourin n=1 Tax=Frankia sp. CiP3 TaxID=2880971 RepID=UPI001EF61B95|nr:protealysin inhibitor emfourin [Frankia sp. CiP3]